MANSTKEEKVKPVGSMGQIASLSVQKKLRGHYENSKLLGHLVLETFAISPSHLVVEHIHDTSICER